MLLGFAALTIGWVGYASSTSALANAEPVDVTVLETNVTTVGSGTDLQYAPAITYEYEYRGKTYRSDSVDPGITTRAYPTREDARAVLEPYEDGETATGYVVPGKPNRSFLRKPTMTQRLASESGNTVAMLIGLPLFLLGLFGAITGAARLDR